MKGKTYGLFAAVLLSACSQHSEAPHAESRSVLGDSEQTRWDFLAAKYDTNGDGAIDSAEYGRGEVGFRELDTNRDGVIVASELSGWEEGLAKAMAPQRVQTIVGPMLLARYFDTNGDHGQLSREELDAAFPSFDSNGDGRIAKAEFDQRLGAMGVPLSAAYDPFQEIAASSVGEGALHLSLSDLHNFFGVLEERRVTGYSIALGERLQPVPNAVGTMAPDFSLPFLHTAEETAPVTLSSFRVDKPVALIFGSYT